MSFGYDGDELGYEAGYGRPVPREEKKYGLCMGEPEQIQITYQCQTPAGKVPTGGGKVTILAGDLPAGASAGPDGSIYNADGWKITKQNGQWVQTADAYVKADDGNTYGRWTKKGGAVEYWKGPPPNQSTKINESDLPGGKWPPPAATNQPPPPDQGKAKAAVGGDPPKPAKAPEGTLSYDGPNELKLRENLRKQGLKPPEVEAFMSRFPEAHENKPQEKTKREAAIASYLPPAKGDDRRDEAHKVEGATADYLRGDITQDLKNRACLNFKKANVTPQQAWDNLYARGLIDSQQSPRPDEKATWKDVKDGKDWSVKPLQGPAAQATAADPLFTKEPGKLTSQGVVDDTKRRNYVASARDSYVDWASSPKDKGGLGLTKEQAQARFNDRAVQLGLMSRESDGSLKVRDDWNPSSTDANSPAQSFFHGKEGEPVSFEPDGTLSKGSVASFRHEDPEGKDISTNPITRVVSENAAKDVNRDALFVSLTGQAPEGSNMKVTKEDGKTFLVAPDGKKTEIRVMDPPLTKAQALAYMQSRGLTDADGKPLPSVSADSFMTETRAIQTGELGPSQIKFRTVAWERNQIVKTLSGPPYNMSGPQITRYMQSKGWLGDTPNIDQMETFRKKAAGAKAGSDEQKQITEEAKAADVAGNDPTEQPEKDRADTIIDTLAQGKGKSDQGAKEGRAGRETSRGEGAAGRDTTLKVETMRQEGEDRRARDRREFDREEKAKDRDFQAEQERTKREHESAERKKDRDNQMMMTLIQFLGSMITGAMQAMAQVESASISSQHQLSGQIIGGIRGRG